MAFYTIVYFFYDGQVGILEKSSRKREGDILSDIKRTNIGLVDLLWISKQPTDTNMELSPSGLDEKTLGNNEKKLSLEPTIVRGGPQKLLQNSGE